MKEDEDEVFCILCKEERKERRKRENRIGREYSNNRVSVCVYHCCVAFKS